ncbi:hypothetical protein [Streptomyces fragilis]|uniref:Uncharacterized protein n=1 Tax=Streptomyces fragilis TaxID=67301 RepID=A0ABV2YRD6_9ACTN|nr:hypothetical protein [Streptomyces fragilis]
MSDEPIPMSSQAEGEREPEPGEAAPERHTNPPHMTPSQAEGEADDEPDDRS